MAIRVQNSSDIFFGARGVPISLTSVVVTHIRIRRASDDGQPIIIALPSATTIDMGDTIKIATGAIDIIYKSGQLNNQHMLAVVESYWGESTSRTAMEVDLLTAVNPSIVVVNDPRYSHSTVTEWTITAESD